MCHLVLLILWPDLASSCGAGYGTGSHAVLGFTLLDSNLASFTTCTVQTETNVWESDS